MVNSSKRIGSQRFAFAYRARSQNERVNVRPAGFRAVNNNSFDGGDGPGKSRSLKSPNLAPGALLHVVARNF
jgi:hypothetical protein